MTKTQTAASKSKATYTVREPGMSYWWQGSTKREAKRELRKAKDAGLTRAIIVVQK